MPLIESFSGIRGIFDESLTEQAALRYAFSYYYFLNTKKSAKQISGVPEIRRISKQNKSKKNNVKIVIGTDTRPSRDIIKNAAIEALNCEIIDLGIAPTPAIELAVRHYNADGGIIITASHNEPYWNGFKFLDNDGAILRPKDINKVIGFYNKIKNLKEKDFLKKYLYNEKNKNDIKLKKIIKKYIEVNEIYSDFILNFLTKEDIQNIKNSKLKIIIDPNGGTAIIARQILEKLGVKVIGVNMQYGIFNRAIEPNIISLIYLESAIKEKNAAFAAAFDCDADRVEIVLENGRLISGHYLLALIIDDILFNLKNKNSIVVVNDATSNIVEYVTNKNNSKLKEVEVGEINVVDEMEKSKSPVGGEGSSAGVIIRPSKCRDGILTLIYILKIIAKKRKTLQDILKEYPQYYTLAAKIEFNPKNHDKIKRFLKKYYLRKGYKVRENGGIKGSLKVLIGEDSFVWFRASKTEANVFRIIADATTTLEAQKLLDEGRQMLEKAKK